MNRQRDADRTHLTSTEPAHDDELAPGRGSRSSRLDAPAHPIAGGLIQRKARDANGVADGAEAAVAAASPGSGSPLPGAIMRKFESSLGADLSGVRVHTGHASAEAAEAIGARAYTVGNDIHFGAGQFDPSSPGGQHLLAHEVAHTVQQSGGARRMQPKLEVSAPQDSAELEADRAADAMVRGERTTVGGAPSSLPRQIMRQGNAHASSLGPSTPPDMAPTSWKSLVTPTPGPAEPSSSDQIAVPATAPLPPGVNKDPRDLGMASCDHDPKEEPWHFGKQEPRYAWSVFDQRSRYWSDYTGTVNATCAILSTAGPTIALYNKAEDDPSLKDLYELQVKDKKGSVADIANQQNVPRTGTETVGAQFKPGTNTANTDGLEDHLKNAGKNEKVEQAITALKAADAKLQGANAAAEKAASKVSASAHALQAAGFAVQMDKAETDKDEAQGEKADIEAKAAAVKGIIDKVATGVSFIASVVATGPAAAAGGVIAIAGAGGQDLQLGTYTPHEAPAPTGAQAAAGKVQSIAGNSMVSTIAGKIVDWYYQAQLDKADAKIRSAVADYKAARKGKATEEWLAASDNVAAELAGLKEAMANVKAEMLLRKNAYAALASAMAEAGGGTPQEQARIKALINAIPVAKAVQAKASNVLNLLSEPPDNAGTQIAFTMALHAGHDHPWKLVSKASNIAGYRQQFQQAYDTWTARVNSLEAIIGGVEGG